MKTEVSDTLANVFIWWGGNSYYPEYGLEYKNNLNEESVASLRKDMEEIIKKQTADCELMNNLTSDMGFQNDQQAADFFESVYKYLFKNGSEPDIDNYTG
ncbi:hypothetical protein K3725_00415 [Leisingera sp. S132]|uniref:hypothetical protein n=1 Tax=Leisingera sp. S132 TaxID=2867016 RepID=UPI0021A54018|nr:hypothetical protein [Leisingera sp. S132]UWQ79507.1 hypothetical protein K3725_00415 [Leisingera sp. S132]